MEIKTSITPPTRTQMYAWFQENHHQHREVWIVMDRSAEHTLTYVDIVEVALCFGWIDSTKKSIGEGQTAQRLSPRTSKSRWTELNRERVRRLETLGEMTEWGRAVVPTIEFQIDADVLQALQADAVVYQNFMAFPELYRRIRIDNIQGYRRDDALFVRRLEKFIEKTRRNECYGDWHDKGRLLDY